MKECFKCHEVLPLSQFYKHPEMGDGHLGKCKRCTRRDVHVNRAARREHYRAYDQRRGKEGDRMARSKASIRKYPLHQWARIATRNAVKRGLLVQTPCEICGDLRSEAHHEDYTQPLRVRWLCRIHHGEAHRMEQAG